VTAGRRQFAPAAQRKIRRRFSFVRRRPRRSVRSHYTFDAIAAILVGGSAVTGGWGSVGPTINRALIIATVTDMLLLVGANTGMQISSRVPVAAPARSRSHGLADSPTGAEMTKARA
jgi:hypothetical protein